MKKAFWWARLIFWCALIFWLSSIPNLKTELGGWDFVLRKIAHIFVYGILYLFAYRAFYGIDNKNGSKTHYMVPLVFSIMYAVSDEFHQGFVVGRHASAIDVGIDAVGALLAMLLKTKSIFEKFFSSRFHATSALIIFLLSFSGCARYEISRLEKLQKHGRFIDAAVGFERFVSKNPTHPLAPFALFRAADIYNYELRLPSKSAALYRKAEQDFSSQAELVEKARQGLLRSPDYMPLADGAKWIEGDSASGGSNMRAIWTAKEISTGNFILEKKFTVGGSDARPVASKKLYYVFKGYSLIEKTSFSSPYEKTFLEYPVYHGKKWKYTDKNSGVTSTMWIEFIQGDVKVRAGKFAECIRIAERANNSDVVKYNYYAPYVGWILTSVGGSKGEHRNSELISYELPSRR